MDGISIKKLARDLGQSSPLVLSKLQDLGFNMRSEDDVVSSKQQLQLAKEMNRNQSSTKKVDEQRIKQEISLEDLQTAKNLASLNDLLTQAMAGRTIQALIKDENLDTVAVTIQDRAELENEPLLAASMLARLAAVARPARASRLFQLADEVIKGEPPSLMTLGDKDGKQKQYAAQMLAHVTAPWIATYRYREAVAIDTADNARRELLAANLALEGNVADWLAALSAQIEQLQGFSSVDTHLRRIRRVFGVMRDVVEHWRGGVGSETGECLAQCVKVLPLRQPAELDEKVLFEATDHLVGILVRIMQLRFSTALYAENYAVLEQGKRTLGPGLWGRFLSASSAIQEVRIALLEAALVIARQNRSDRRLMAVLGASYTSRALIAAEIKRHFQEARDLDPEIAEWWRRGEDLSETQRQVEHRVGNSEDAQIGALLVEVEGNRLAMETLRESVVPYLEISEPPKASTVRKAVDGYQKIAQTTRRLARMRKLTKTDLKGERLEYNPVEHEMLGGHRSGIRRVKVVRDGIQKEFGGKIKTLVKPWVEAESD